MPDSTTPPHRRTGPWIMHMRWLNLLFMHWPVSAQVMRRLVPAGLEIDTFENQAWLGIVPFRMSNVRPRCLPPLGASAFPELNVRTYVSHRGRPGIWFFSLDAASKLAVRAARLAWYLPYFDATMTVNLSGDQVVYDSVRTHLHAPAARLAVRYRPTGPACPGGQRDIDRFLTNRLCLFTADRQGRLRRGDIDHPPWPLRPAEAEIQTNDMTRQIGLTLPDVPPLLHYADRLDVVAWKIKPV